VRPSVNVGEKLTERQPHLLLSPTQRHWHFWKCLAYAARVQPCLGTFSARLD